MATACADTETAPDTEVQDGGALPSFDASTGPALPFDGGAAVDSGPSIPWSNDAGASDGSAAIPSARPDAAAPADAGDPLQGAIGSLGDLFPAGDASAPVNPGPGGELDPKGAVNPQLPPKSSNPPECPSLAPPNPVGNCLGLPIYLICSYGAESGGQQYTCTCDWYHWLCA